MNREDYNRSMVRRGLAMGLDAGDVADIMRDAEDED